MRSILAGTAGPARLDIPNRLLIMMVTLAPLWWLLGVSFFIYHFLALTVLFLMLLFRGQGLKINWGMILIAAYIVINATSIILNSGDADLSRIVAALYNLSYWIVGFSVVAVLFNVSNTAVLDRGMSRAAQIILLTILMVSVLFYLVKGGETIVRYPSLLGLFFDVGNVSPLLADSSGLYVFNIEWEDINAKVRSSVLSPYPTAMAGLSLLAFPLAFKGARTLFGRCVIVLCVVAALWFARSRAAYICFALFLLLLALNLPGSRILRIWVSYILVLSVLLVVTTGLLGQLMSNVQDTRASSSELRYSLYSDSIHYGLENGPFIGVGVKPRSDYEVPLGSHSHWIGGFMKTGFLGLMTLVGLQALIFIMWVRVGFRRILMEQSHDSLRYWALSMLMAFSVFLLFEDLDAPQLMCVFYFVLLGISLVAERKPASVQASPEAAA